MKEKKNERFIGRKGIYSKKTREDLMEKGAISSGEDGFMEGYNHPEYIFTEEIRSEEE